MNRIKLTCFILAFAFWGMYAGYDPEFQTSYPVSCVCQSGTMPDATVNDELLHYMPRNYDQTSYDYPGNRYTDIARAGLAACIAPCSGAANEPRSVVRACYENKCVKQQQS